MPTPCAFCAIVRKESPADVVLEDEECVGFLDLKPVFPGHVLLVPRTHVETLGDLPDALVGSLFSRARLLARAVEYGLGAEGAFVALNNKVSQSVPHLHVHVVPRRKGDGLRGFFWPRTRYSSDEERAAIASKLREAVERLRA